MSYSSNSFLKPIGSDKNIKFYDNTGSLTYTVKPTFITDVIDEVNLLRVILKSSKEIKLDFINTDEPILAKSILLEQISTLLQTNDYVDNSQTIVGYTTAPYSYYTFLRPLAQSDRNIKILGVDLLVKYTIDPFTINNTNVSGNLIRINLKSNRIITLEFSTSNESKLSLIRLREQIDILIQKVPLLIDKDIENYIDSKILSGPTGSQYYSFSNITSSVISGTYTVTNNDFLKTLVYTGTASINLLLSSSLTFIEGTYITLLQKSSGQITVVGSGVVISTTSDVIATTYGVNSIADILVYSVSSPEVIVSGKLRFV